MQFLFELAEGGSIKSASQWRISSYLFGSKADTSPNHMRNLGMAVAKRILEQESDSGKAAAILLLTALDSAYNSVLAACLLDATVLEW